MYNLYTCIYIQELYTSLEFLNILFIYITNISTTTFIQVVRSFLLISLDVIATVPDNLLSVSLDEASINFCFCSLVKVNDSPLKSTVLVC